MGPLWQIILLFVTSTPTLGQQFSHQPSVFPAKDMVVVVRGNLVSSGSTTICTNLTLIRLPVTAYNASGPLAIGPIARVLPRVSLPGSPHVVAGPGHLPCTGMVPAGPSAFQDLQRSGCGRYLITTCYGCPVGSTTCTTQVIARTDWRGSVDTTTSFPNGGVIFTSAYSVNGRGYYVTGFTGAGVRYVVHGGNTSTLLTALAHLSYAQRVLVYMGELYATAHFSNPSMKRGVVTIGSGLAPTSGSSNPVAVIPGRMEIQDPEQLLCMGFEFTSPRRITAACDTATDGNDYYNYFKIDDPFVGSPGRSTFPNLHMVARWGGGLIFFGSVRCFEAANQGGCGTRPSGTPGACLAGVQSAPTASNCSGYYYLNGNMVDGFDAGSDSMPTNAPLQSSSVFGLGFGNTAGANYGGIAPPPYNPPLEAITVLAVNSGALGPGSLTPSRILLLSYLAQPVGLSSWSSGVPLGAPLYLTETLRAGVSSWGTTDAPHPQGLNDCVVPAWPNATTGATLSRSEDGRFLLLPCFNALPTGMGSALNSAARVIVRLAGDGSLPDATVGLTDFPGTPTSIASADGTVLYIAGRGSAPGDASASAASGSSWNATTGTTSGGGAIRVAYWTGAGVTRSTSLLNASSPIASLTMEDYTLLAVAVGVRGWATVGAPNGAPNWQPWQPDPAPAHPAPLAAGGALLTSPAAVLPQNRTLVWVADAAAGGALVPCAWRGSAWAIVGRFPLPSLAITRGASPMAATARRRDALNGNCSFAIYVTTPTHALVFNTDLQSWAVIASAPREYNFQGVAIPAAADLLIAPSASPSMTKSHSASPSALPSPSPPPTFTRSSPTPSFSPTISISPPPSPTPPAPTPSPHPSTTPAPSQAPTTSTAPTAYPTPSLAPTPSLGTPATTASEQVVG